MSLVDLKLELSVKAKNGVDFISAAAVLWIAISVIWSLDFTTYNKSVLTFMVSGIMLPLAFIFSKIYKTEWKVPGNALQSLGIWLNVAQLFYFPFLIFLLLKAPDFFVMGYAIITGAHLFPYAWFYEEKAYAFAAGLVSIGAFLIAISVEDAEMFYIPIFTATILTFLGISIYVSTNKKNKVIVH